jgi:hypothetical protein
MAVWAARLALETGMNSMMVEPPARPMKTGSSNSLEQPYTEWYLTAFPSLNVNARKIVDFEECG